MTSKLIATFGYTFKRWSLTEFTNFTSSVHSLLHTTLLMQMIQTYFNVGAGW